MEFLGIDFSGNVQAKQERETKVKKIEKDRASVDQRSQVENARWEKQEKLETTLRKARD
jgi:colicin import membrane protein